MIPTNYYSLVNENEQRKADTTLLVEKAKNPFLDTQYFEELIKKYQRKPPYCDREEKMPLRGSYIELSRPLFKNLINRLYEEGIVGGGHRSFNRGLQ